MVSYFKKFFEVTGIPQVNILQSIEVDNKTFELPLDLQSGTVPFKIGSKSNTILLKPIFTLDMTVVSARNCSNCPVKSYDSI